MGYFVVTYDLKKKDWPKYTTLTNELETMDSVKFQESCWFVDQSKTAGELLDELKSYIHEDDRLMIVKFDTKPKFTNALKGTKAWITARFP